MAQSNYHLEGLDVTSARDIALDAHIGLLVTNIGEAGRTWVDWNVNAHRFLRHRLLLSSGAFLEVTPRVPDDKDSGFLIRTSTPDLPREGFTQVQHAFDQDWEPVDGGKIEVIDAGNPHTYRLQLEDGAYHVNEHSYLDDSSLDRIGRAASFVARQMTAVRLDIRDEYYYS
jgi:hypothetical protein